MIDGPVQLLNLYVMVQESVKQTHPAEIETELSWILAQTPVHLYVTEWKHHWPLTLAEP